MAKNIHEFKADVLARQVILPFVAARGEGRDSLPASRDDRLIIAGFGNKATDAKAYEMAGVDRRDIYIVDKESRILCMGGDDETGPRDETGKDQDFNFDLSVACPDGNGTAELQGSKGKDSSFNIPSERSHARSCPAGVPENDTFLSELTAAPVQVNNTDCTARSIHSVELSLGEERAGTPADSSVLARAKVETYTTKTPTESFGSTSTGARSRGRKRDKFRRSLQKKSQSIRAFTSKSSFASSISSVSSTSDSGKSTAKRLYDGYGDPRLSDRVRDRMIN